MRDGGALSFGLEVVLHGIFDLILSVLLEVHIERLHKLNFLLGRFLLAPQAFRLRRRGSPVRPLLY